MAWPSPRVRALRLPAADLGAHPRGLLEPRLGRALQRPGFRRRLGRQPVSGEGAAAGDVRAADGLAAAAVDRGIDAVLHAAPPRPAPRSPLESKPGTRWGVAQR